MILSQEVSPSPGAVKGPAKSRRYIEARTFLLVSAVAFLVINTVFSAPQAPAGDESWRWSTVAVAAALSSWNIASAYKAYTSAGLLSVRGFLHAWCFFAFSFPAAEMTYRYRSLTLGRWQTATDRPVLLQAILVLAVFQVLFFYGLGKDPRLALRTFAQTSRTRRPRPIIGVIFLMLLVPLVVARFNVIRQLGVRGAAETMVTRTDFFQRLPNEAPPFQFLLQVLFPIYAVSLLCLAIKYLLPHPSRLGRLAFGATLLLAAAGVVFTGGRGDLVYVALTVGIFMYVQGYQRLSQYRPLVVPMLLLFATMVMTAQARHGAENSLARLGGQPTVGEDYASKDITQLLGIGRFDAVILILDKQGTELLGGKSYYSALAEGVNATFVPRIVLGDRLRTYRISDEVLGYWIFGKKTASALPSAPGELLLNFGPVGIPLGALALGLAARFLLRWVLGFRGPIEFVWILTLWTVARILSDESFLVAHFVGSNWPLVIAFTIVIVRRRSSARRSAEPSIVPTRSRWVPPSGARPRLSGTTP